MANPLPKQSPETLLSYLRLALNFVLLLSAVLFAFSNKDPVQLALWPTPWKTQLPLSGVVLAAVIVAYFMGALSRWLPMMSLRRRLKRAETDLLETQAQLRTTMQQLTALQLAIPPTASAAPHPPAPYNDI